MNKIKIAIEQLLCYGVSKNLIEEIDKLYSRNLLLNMLNIDEPATDFNKKEYDPPKKPFEILDVINDYAIEANIIEDTITNRDLFDTKIMDAITPFPSAVLNKYNEIKNKNGIKAATDWYFTFSKSTNYIRCERIEKNIKWAYKDERYGELEVTINLSKPEKDPAEIAKLKTMPKAGYPACFLCAENMGYAGRLNHPARQTHRILPLTLNEESWFYQYSPYVYYNEHCIVLKGEHVPMHICRDTFVRLLEFTKEIPHYFLGSNAGLPIVGGSILNHDHYQGGGYEMPMAKAPIYKELKFTKFKGVKAGLVKWPMSCLRIMHEDLYYLSDVATYILESWEAYSDETRGIYAKTNGENHNAITPIARKRDGVYEIDLVLRNNITTEDLPMGVFHPHPQLHHIKKENIGLIEVMGVFILPGRLKSEISMIEDILTGVANKSNMDESLEKHKHWIDQMLEEVKTPLKQQQAKELIENEIGRICVEVIECAGVFKDTVDGRMGFYEFVKSCGME